jgi:hypothetical protein
MVPTIDKFIKLKSVSDPLPPDKNKAIFSGKIRQSRTRSISLNPLRTDQTGPYENTVIYTKGNTLQNIFTFKRVFSMISLNCKCITI